MNLHYPLVPLYIYYILVSRLQFALTYKYITLIYFNNYTYNIHIKYLCRVFGKYYLNFCITIIDYKY